MPTSVKYTGHFDAWIEVISFINSLTQNKENIMSLAVSHTVDTSNQSNKIKLTDALNMPVQWCGRQVRELHNLNAIRHSQGYLPAMTQMVLAAVAIAAFIPCSILGGISFCIRTDDKPSHPTVETPSQSARFEAYLDLHKQNPQVMGPIFDANKGEIEIVLDPVKMAQVEQETGQRVGIMAENKWQIYIVDPVKFGNGTYGTYGRLIWKQTFKGVTGAAIMPILQNGKVLLNRIHRHPTRGWRLEIPRGVGNGAEAAAALARRELKEETGVTVAEPKLLGKIDPDSGLTPGNIPIFSARVIRSGGKHNRDAAEAGISNLEFSREELLEGFRKGSLIVKINGKMEEIILQDPFLAFALLRSDEKDFSVIKSS